MKLPERISCMPRPMAPEPDPFTAHFWTALEQRRFEAPRCESCGLLQFPPRPVCPACHSDRLHWVPLSGHGQLYTRTRIHAAGGTFSWMTPYSVGVIDLDEGLRVLTRLLHSASRLSPGSAVQLVVLRHTDGPLFAAIKAAEKENEE